MSVFNEVTDELTYQSMKWGHTVDDTKNTPWMWVAYIAHQSVKWMRGSFPPVSSTEADAFRKAMIKTAAVAIAAVESLDRQRSKNVAAFYETLP